MSARQQRGFLLNPFRFGPGGGGSDPNFANVSLLCHFDGADGSTTVTDSSSNNFTATVNGDAHIETDQSVFGGASLYCDGTGDYVSFPDNTAFEFGSGLFTVEFRLRIPTGAGSTVGIINKGGWPGTPASSFLVFYGASGELALYCSNDSNNWNVVSNATFLASTPLDTWIAVLFEYNGTHMSGYTDGTRRFQVSTASGLVDTSSPLTILAGAAGAAPARAYMDELRITKGVARANGAASYTVATAAFPDS